MKKDYFENNALLLDSDAKVQHFSTKSKKKRKIFFNYLRQHLKFVTKGIFRSKTCRDQHG